MHSTAQTSRVELTPRPSLVSKLGAGFIDFSVRERSFLIILGLLFLVAGATYDRPQIAMWFGFALAAYSAVANDSIQTIGTFIASNRQRPWWLLWLFIGGIFLATVSFSWWRYAGDVSYGRLMSKGFAQAPTSFHFLQVAAPIFLIIMTRLRMPVSTTFLLLSSFAASGSSITSMAVKSLSGYVLAFAVALTTWLALSSWMQRRFTGKAHPLWSVGQWITTGWLWSVWLMQDAANIAVYLPRSLSGGELIVFGGVVFLGLGLLFYMRGEKIQQVVEEKSHVVDVRAATVIDFIYALVLFTFKEISQIPMSTTWVFVGLLAGRELGMALRRAGAEGRTWRQAGRMMGKDLLYVSIGFIVSLVIAALVNPKIGEALFK